MLDRVLIIRVYKELKIQRIRKQAIQLKMFCRFQQCIKIRTKKLSISNSVHCPYKLSDTNSNNFEISFYPFIMAEINKTTDKRHW